MSSPQRPAPSLRSLDAVSRQHLGDVERMLADAVAGPDVVHAALRYHLETGGKRLRALIPGWIATNLGGDVSAGLALGVAVELVHNGTLIHDDVQDGDEVRRGRPTVWRAFGMPQAINAGSWLMFAGASLASRADASGVAVDLLQRALMRVIEGQGLEFELQGRDAPTTAEWETMARAKTGVLFGAACALGAVASGLEPGQRADLAAYGEDLGVFFQLQDDLLDLLGDKGRGATATDIAEGKISHPVAWVAEHGEPASRARLLAIIRTPRAETGDALIAEALDLLRTSGALEASLASLAARAKALEGAPWASATPGLVARVLAPLAHIVT